MSPITPNSGARISDESKNFSDLEAGFREGSMEQVDLESEPPSHDDLPETGGENDVCARNIIIWTPICCMLFLCGMGAVGLGWKGIAAIIGT